MAEYAVRSGFAEALAEGRLQWLSLDYDDPDKQHYKKDYGLVSSNVVLVRRRGGKDVSFVRLDEVWKLAHEEKAFRSYVSSAIAAELGRSK
ncbi:MAG: hypothetical protein Fur0037_10860 [Planctomycetota bacterium]